MTAPSQENLSVEIVHPRELTPLENNRRQATELRRRRWFSSISIGIGLLSRIYALRVSRSP
jgi:hypothetical protein